MLFILNCVRMPAVECQHMYSGSVSNVGFGGVEHALGRFAAGRKEKRGKEEGRGDSGGRDSSHILSEGTVERMDIGMGSKML